MQTSVLALGAILKQQKGRHETVVVEPAAVAAAHRPLYAHRPLSPPEGGWHDWAQFGDRPDNVWMQYDSATAPRDAEQWQQARFVHKMKWGYARWPAEMRVYRQRADGEPPAPPPAGTEPAVQAVRAFVESPESVAGLVQFLSLEEHKGRDMFAEAPFLLFKVSGERRRTAQLGDWNGRRTVGQWLVPHSRVIGGCLIFSEAVCFIVIFYNYNVLRQRLLELGLKW